MAGRGSDREVGFGDSLGGGCCVVARREKTKGKRERRGYVLVSCFYPGASVHVNM